MELALCLLAAPGETAEMILYPCTSASHTPFLSPHLALALAPTPGSTRPSHMAASTSFPSRATPRFRALSTSSPLHPTSCPTVPHLICTASHFLPHCAPFPLHRIPLPLSLYPISCLTASHFSHGTLLPCSLLPCHCLGRCTLQLIHYSLPTPSGPNSPQCSALLLQPLTLGTGILLFHLGPECTPCPHVCPES